MGLRILPAVGEALNFGGRRMETIARVAWLPLLLSMIASMAAVFAMLSVIAGRLITFADISGFIAAQTLVAKHAATGFEKDPQAMWMITLASVLVQTLLTASFMAPLIRYAGLGEKPAPGFIRAPFGADQLRFVISSIFGFLFVAVLVFGPVAAASFYALKYIAVALSQTIAVFPDPASLHTIEIKTAADVAAANGGGWLFDRAIPMAAAAPLAVIFWAILFFHFHPDNRPVSAIKGNPLLRALVTFLVAAALLAAAYFIFAGVMVAQFQSQTIFFGMATGVAGLFPIDVSEFGKALNLLLTSPAGRVVFFAAVSFFLVNYFSLRLFAYPGVAVCRRSMGLGGTLSVTRGWNILRLWVIVTLLGLFLFVMQVFILNEFLLKSVLPGVINLLYKATAVSTKLVNSGSTADWVMPTFVWIWNITKIVINVLWSFFSFGVTAGLYGRLYRESEQAH